MGTNGSSASCSTKISEITGDPDNKTRFPVGFLEIRDGRLKKSCLSWMDGEFEMDSTTRLLFLAKSGGRSAVNRLCSRLWPKAVEMARRRALRSGLRQQEEDIAQSAMMRLWSAIHPFSSSGANLLNRFSLYHFLGVWIKESYLKTLRKAHAKKRDFGRAVPLRENSVAMTGSGKADSVLVRDVMARAMDETCPTRRPAINLYYAKGHTVEDIAVLLGKSGRTVERHLKEFRIRFKEKWGEP